MIIYAKLTRVLFAMNSFFVLFSNLKGDNVHLGRIFLLNSRLSYSYSEASLRSFTLSLNALFVIFNKCNNIALPRDATSISHEVYFVVNQITCKFRRYCMPSVNIL